MINRDMSGVVTAASIAPHAFEEGGMEEEDGEFELDLGNLCAYSLTSLDPSALRVGREAQLAELAGVGTQALINKLFQLPVQPSDVGPLAELPKPTTVLPREKPAPKAKEETRWEAFAKEKGIKKRKRERMVWDEEKKEWAPRWGYKRVNDESKVWAIPVKDGTDSMADPFLDQAMKKKERVVKNKLNQLKNLARAPSADKESKDLKTARLSVAQLSTASMGKFDRGIKHEPKKKKLPGEKVALLPTEKITDKARDLDIIKRVLGGDSERRSVGAGAGSSEGSDGGRSKKGGKPKGKKSMRSGPPKGAPKDSPAPKGKKGGFKKK